MVPSLRSGILIASPACCIHRPRRYAPQCFVAGIPASRLATRNAVKTPGETARGAGERPRCDATRRTRPEVPCAALFWAEAGIPRSEAESPKAMSIRGAEPTKTRRVAQDCDPKTYMYMSSISPEAVGRIAKRALAGCRKDARIGHFSWYPPSAKRESAKRMP